MLSSRQFARAAIVARIESLTVLAGCPSTQRMGGAAMSFDAASVEKSMRPTMAFPEGRQACDRAR
ncbi:hypothetical protein ASF32_21530 [Methylobacterium sp. Leaf91]|nr:hypothetical protein ASF32_21530 [Methylobacterium sp. Leaf91]